MTTKKVSPTAILAVVAFGVFVAADDLTVVSTMLRQIIFDLEIPLPDELNRAAWIVNAYLIAYVVVMPFVGRLSDIVGRRAIFITSLLLFMVGSLWTPFAGSLNSFIWGRVVTAVGGGAMVPVAMAVVGDVYPRDKRATALGTLGAVDTAGWVWGPLYGALLVRYLSWHWQFYLNVPLSIIGIVLAWWALADLPEPKTKERIDWLGTAVLTLSILTLNIALLGSGDVQVSGSFAAFNQPSSINTTLYYTIAVISFLLFMLIEWWLGKRTVSRNSYLVNRNPKFTNRLRITNHESRITNYGSRITNYGSRITNYGSRITNYGLRITQAPPLINLHLFRRRNFSTAVFINFLVGSILIIAMVNVPLLVNVLEFDPPQAALISGFLLSGLTLAMAVMSYIGGRQTEKRGYRLVTAVGLSFCVLGFGLMGLTWSVDTVYSQMIWQLVLLGIGFGLVIAPVSTAVINAAPETQRGVASSLVIVMRLIGMSVGLSGLTTWGLRRFQQLRPQIELPQLPLTDPQYQQALVEGLTRVTVDVLVETFLISALVAVAALGVAMWLKGDTAV